MRCAKLMILLGAFGGLATVRAVCPTGIDTSSSEDADVMEVSLHKPEADGKSGEVDAGEVDEKPQSGEVDEKPQGGKANTKGGKPTGKDGNKIATDGGKRVRRTDSDTHTEDDGSGSGEDEVLPYNVKVKVHGSSGKFSIYDASADSAACDPSSVTVTMDFLRELDSSGNAVGTSGSTKHSINTFAPQKFEIAPTEVVELGTTTATLISFATPFKGLADAKLTVDTYIVRAGGVVETPTETWNVIPGDVKFNLAIQDWDWCGETSTCGKGQSVEEGEFIDVGITITGSSTFESKPSGDKDGKSFKVGNGVTLELSNSVMIDGEWTTMPDGYPLTTLKGSQSTIVFRFPKFTKSAVYDPLIQKDESIPSLSELYNTDTGEWIGPTLFDDDGNFIGSEEEADLYASFLKFDENGNVVGMHTGATQEEEDNDGGSATNNASVLCPSSLLIALLWMVSLIRLDMPYR